MKILVTGAAGFIGSHTVERLLAEGHRVIGVDNFRTGRKRNLAFVSENSAFSLQEGDITVPGLLREIARRHEPEAFIHLAALVSVHESIQNPKLNYQLNLGATQTVAEVALEQGIRRVVFASSAAVYGKNPVLPLREESQCSPISPYGAAKLASENLLFGYAATYGITVRCQRYFNVYGSRQDPSSPYSGVISVFLRNCLCGLPSRVFGTGEQSRDFISVEDVARANVIAATQAGVESGVANICTGRQTSLLQLLGMLRKHYHEVTGPIHDNARSGDIIHSVGWPEKARQELGFVADVEIEPGLASLVRSENSVRDSSIA